MPGSGDDWVAILDRLLAGDRLAFLRVNRLVTGVLVEMRAYDFRDEWDDLRQEVVRSVIANAQAGRLSEPGALPGYVRIVTRNGAVARLKASFPACVPEAAGRSAATGESPSPDVEEIREVWSAVRELPVAQQQVLDGLYRQGKSYRAVSAETGVPLGAMGRRLRDAFAALRRRFVGDGEIG